jgi:hypothetical protein
MTSSKTKELKGLDLAALYASIDKINHRLDKLEGIHPNSTLEIFKNPSLDKFNVAEAIADEIFLGLKKEKACQFEPGKPCDHCSMCNSRGF